MQARIEDYDLDLVNSAIAIQGKSDSRCLQIQDVLYHVRHNIVLDGSAIESLENASEPRIIFYLTHEDERNGFGTVKHLDEDYKMLTVLFDESPEYTYLFYRDAEGTCQTLLACIEFASRTDRGQFFGHAKIHGPGLDLDKLTRSISESPQS